jgi:hypothetical protein
VRWDGQLTSELPAEQILNLSIFFPISPCGLWELQEGPEMRLANQGMSPCPQQWAQRHTSDPACHSVHFTSPPHSARLRGGHVARWTKKKNVDLKCFRVPKPFLLGPLRE